MGENLANNVEYQTSEQISNVDNQTLENSTHNKLNFEETNGVISNRKSKPMQPTRLERSWWSTYPRATGAGAFGLFIITTTFIGVLIVCLTAKKINPKCELKFKKTAQNPIQYNYGPRSIAIGDFNNDTWPDFVVANIITNNMVIYLGSSNGSFNEQLSYSTGFDSNPNMVVVGDINNDYRLDIVVSNFGIHNIGIFLGLGNASFANMIESSTTISRPLAICLADFNNDTFMDIVTADYGIHSVSIFYGYGNGSFSNAITFFTGYDSYSSSVAAGDFNNDKYLDLVIANYGTDNIGLFFGHNKSILADHLIFSTGSGSRPISIAVGYLNDDTLLDVAVANSGTNQIGILLNHDNGRFKYQNIYSIDPGSPQSIGVADFNRDKRLDLIVVNKGTNNIGVLLGHGNGTFESAKMYSIGSTWSISFATADFNRDNRLDLAVVSNDTQVIHILFGYFEGFSNSTTYLTGSSPRSVGVGDFNSDTHLDIVVVNYFDHDLSILLGSNDGSFANETKYTTGGLPYSVAVGDFNNDAHLDIVVVNALSNDISVLLGYGDGSFANQTKYSNGHDIYPGYPTGYGPYSVAVGDFNNDTHLDIVVANYLYDDVTILLGYGDGSFPNETKYSSGYYPYSIYPVGHGPYSVAVGDFSSDTHLDIVVVNYDDRDVSVLLGHGDGSFAILTTYLTGISPMSVAVGDFNNDTFLDIVVPNYDDRDVSVLLGHGDGSFANQVKYSTGGFPRSVAVGDFNNDTHLDIVVANRFYNGVNVLLGHSDGSFTTLTTYLTGLMPMSVVAGDFNNDTLLDIVVTNDAHDSVSVFLQYNRGTLQYSMTITFGSASRLQSAVATDINNDKGIDLIVANYGTNNIGFILGYRNGTFGTQNLLSSGLESRPSFITIADFNNDSQLDIAVINHVNRTVDIYLQNRPDKFVQQINTGFHSRFVPVVIAHGDFNNDRRAEIVVTYSDSDNVDILAPYSTDSFVNVTTFSTGDRPCSVAVGNFNNDTHLDIVVVNSNSNDVSVLLGLRDGSFANQTKYLTGQYPRSVAVGDFNNDAHLDIVVVNALSNDISVLLGYGDGSFANQTKYVTGWNPRSLGVGDFNSDTHLDIVVVNYDDRDVSVLLGHGDGSFANQTKYSTDFRSYSVAVGDFNNDTHLDIVVVNSYSKGVRVLLGHSDGSFTSQATYSTGDAPRFVIVGDFNNDAHLDIVVANSDSNDINVFLGYGDGFFTNQTTYSTDLTPNSIAVGDFNNDTHLDIVVTNYFGNDVSVFLGYGNGSFTNQTIYSTGSGPYSVALGKFNDDIYLDMVVVNMLANNVAVLFGRFNQVFRHHMTLSNANGSRPSSFVTGDFNNDDRMDVAIAYSGMHNVGVFLGYGNISFSKEQSFPIGFGLFLYLIAVGDFDNDTFLDIVIVSSDSNAIGIFLGCGNGSFTKERTYSTDSSSLSVVVNDFNNDFILDIMVAFYDTNNVGILLGYGDGTFANAALIPLEHNAHPFLVLGADFNGDRKLDFAVVNNGSDSLQIFLQTC